MAIEWPIPLWCWCHVIAYISSQILHHQKLEMFGIARKCVQEHEILQRIFFILMIYLHVQYYIFLKYKTWELKGHIFPPILRFSIMQKMCCGGQERILARPLFCLHNTCWNKATPILLQQQHQQQGPGSRRNMSRASGKLCFYFVFVLFLFYLTAQLGLLNT